MSDLSAQYTTDPAFREVANLLFGDGLVAKAVETMDPATAQAKRERTEARIGLASNVVGIAAGVHALKDAAKSPHLRKPLGARGSMRFKVTGKTKALAAASAGIQAVNLIGDYAANRSLSRSSKKKIDAESTPSTVTKRLTPIKKDSPSGPDLHVPGGRLTSVTAKTGKAAKKVVNAEAKTNRYTNRGKLVMMGVDRVKEEKKKVFGKDQTFEFSKVDEDKRQVFGWASIVKKDGEHVVDLQGDYIDIDEIEKSAYDYVQKSRQGGDMHQRNGEAPKVVGTMIESFIVTPEKIEKMGLPPETPLGWWVGYQVEDPEVWEMVKTGKRTGFSIHGRGQRTPTVI